MPNIFTFGGSASGDGGGGGGSSGSNVITDTCSITITNKDTNFLALVYWGAIESNGTIRTNHQTLDNYQAAITIDVPCGSRFAIHYSSAFPAITTTGGVEYEGYDPVPWVGSRVHYFVAPSTPGAVAAVDITDDE